MVGIGFFQGAAADALEEDEPQRGRKARNAVAGKPVISRPLIAALAFVSGFNLLAMEVVWTRMLAQIHENSAYGFATVLIVVLVCLSLGAWLAWRLARSKMPAPQVLLWLFALGGTALAMTPLISMGITRQITLDAGRDKQLAVEGATHLDMQELMLPINEQTILLFYGGNLTRAADLFEKYPLNTHDKPVRL